MHANFNNASERGVIQVLLMKMQGKVMVIAAGLKFDLFGF